MSRTAYAVMMTLQLLTLGLLLFVTFRLGCPSCYRPTPTPMDLSSIDTSDWEIETTPSGETVLVSPEVVVETLPSFHKSSSTSVTKNFELGKLPDYLMSEAERYDEMSADEQQ